MSVHLTPLLNILQWLPPHLDGSLKSSPWLTYPYKGMYKVCEPTHTTSPTPAVTPTSAIMLSFTPITITALASSLVQRNVKHVSTPGPLYLPFLLLGISINHVLTSFRSLLKWPLFRQAFSECYVKKHSPTLLLLGFIFLKRLITTWHICFLLCFPQLSGKLLEVRSFIYFVRPLTVVSSQDYLAAWLEQY